MKLIISALGVVLSCAVCFAQEPPAPPTPASQGTSTAGQQAPASKPPVDKQGRPLPSFLIIGTVFNEHGLSFPCVEVRIRRADEKKFHETETNSRGEFAMRVFPGYKYEVVTHAKKYRDESRTVDASVDVQQRLSIKLERLDQTKAGAKP